ncbi:MAG: hypothetical protein R3F59_05755 [Myxococcota bacterium]
MAAPLVPASGSWLTRPRTVGSPAQWARQGAVLGGLLGGFTPMALGLLVALFDANAPFLFVVFNPAVGAGALAGVLVGGLLGLVQPALLDSVRGRLPLPLVALGQGLVAALAGAVAGGLSLAIPLTAIGGLALLDLEVIRVGAWLGGAVGGAAGLLGWLPLTVATVLKSRSWPITAAVGAGVPASLMLVLGLLGVLLA